MKFKDLCDFTSRDTYCILGILPNKNDFCTIISPLMTNYLWYNKDTNVSKNHDHGTMINGQQKWSLLNTWCVKANLFSAGKTGIPDVVSLRI